MSNKVARLFAEIGVNDLLTPQLKNAKMGLSDFGAGLLKGVGSLVGITSAAGIAAAAVKAFKTAIDSAAESETAFVTMEATIQSMGREGEISAGKVQRLAEALMKVTNVDDEALMNASEIFLRMESFDPSNLEKMLKVTADYAAGTGQDMASAAQAVSMALETGNTRALKFSAAVRDQITTMIKAGDSAGALALIMKTLNDKFGGQAAKQMDTYKGSVETLKIATGEFWEAVGKGTLGPGKAFNQWLAGNIDLITTHVEASYDEAEAYTYAMKRIVAENVASGEIFAFTPKAQQSQSDRIKAYEQEYLKWAALTELMTLRADALAEKENDAAEAARNLALANEAAAIAANDAYQKYIANQSSWELAYTGLTTVEEKGKSTFELLGSMVQDLQGSGAEVWNQFLLATGKLSEESLLTFAKVQAAFDFLKAQLSMGFTIPMAVSMTMAQYHELFEPPAAAPTGSGGTITLAPWATEADKAYARAHPETYAPLASGGSYDPNKMTVVGDIPGQGWGPNAEILYKNMVIPHPAAQKMKDTGMLDGAYRAADGGFWAGTHWVPVGGVSTDTPLSRMPTMFYRNQYNTPPGTDPSSYSDYNAAVQGYYESNPGLGGVPGSPLPYSSLSPSVPAIQSAIETSIQAAVEAAVSQSATTTQASVAPVAVAAQQISESGQRTASETARNTQTSTRDMQTLLAEIKGLRMDMARRDSNLRNQLEASRARIV